MDSFYIDINCWKFTQSRIFKNAFNFIQIFAKKSSFSIKNKVLIAVKEDLEKLREKQVSTGELVDWMDKLVVAHTINEALKIEDDSNPTCVVNGWSFAVLNSVTD